MKFVRLILIVLLAMLVHHVFAQPPLPPGPPLTITKKALTKPKISTALSPKAQTAANQSLVIQTNVNVYSNILIIVWHSDYMGYTNVGTEIDGCKGLVDTNWYQKFVSQATNGYISPSNHMEFFRGKTVFVNPNSNP